MARTKYPIHPDFKRWENFNPPLNETSIPLLQKLMGVLILKEPITSKIPVERVDIAVSDGASIRALLYSPSNVISNAPCLVYYHGGGFVLPAGPFHYTLAKEYAVRANCKVLFVDYRLAPQYPFPVAPEDCYTAYQWVLNFAEKLSINPARIAVGGDSAGGNLATVVCLMARDRGLPIPCAQMMIYPVAGMKLSTDSMRKYTDTPMCNSKDADKYDQFYMQDTSAGKHEYYSPYEAESLTKLPATYIETAEFDCLRDGGILYAERLREFGVSVELLNTVGTIHGFDIALNSPIVRECIDKRIAFLLKTFNSSSEK
jgi:acetyl esterase/lipase